MQAKALTLAAHDTVAINRATIVSFLTIALYLLFCSALIAECITGDATDTPMGEVLCEVVFFIYGNLGRGLATIAIILLGIGALLGKTSWGMAVTVGVGISVIFNAETLALILLCGGSASSETMC